MWVFLINPLDQKASHKYIELPILKVNKLNAPIKFNCDNKLKIYYMPNLWKHCNWSYIYVYLTSDDYWI